MFDLTEGTLSFDRKTLPILSWSVWFATPKGLVTTLKEAVEICEAMDFDPNGSIAPVAVALDEAGRSEVIVRGR